MKAVKGQPRLEVPRPRLRRASVIIPAYNEAPTIGAVVAAVRRALGEAALEVLVVDDGSRDGTAAAARAAGARVLRHPYNLGNGAAVKTGLRAARGEAVLLLDADGQHPAEALPKLLRLLETYDMVVAARGLGAHANWLRAAANRCLNLLARYVTGFPVRDLTSGLRAVRREVARRFLYLLPNTFSYPTTLTLALLRAGHTVHYVDLPVSPRRAGPSKIRPLRDGCRFFLIVIKLATFFAPLRVFLPAAGCIFALGVGYYLYTFLTQHRFTNMGVLLLVLSFLTFAVGLVSEQIAQLRFDRTEEPCA